MAPSATTPSHANAKPAASAAAAAGSDRNVKHVVLGDLLFQTWYQSIYPDDLVSKATDRLHVCRWCFRYSCDVALYAQHTRCCPHRNSPPGTKVYDHGGYSVWELDGEEHKLYAQDLSLFAKLFLDHKSVFFDVVSFLYYLLVFTDPDGPDDYHILGFFSKEKLSWDANNLACILIFPPYQHKQLGKLLMGVSYKLSGWERDTGLIGGPEKPLSEMGHKSYSRFWEERIARFLLLRNVEDAANEDTTRKQKTVKSRKRHAQEVMTVEDIGLATGMLTEDVVTALKGMGLMEPATPSRKRRVNQPTEDADDAPRVILRKSDVLAWAKGRRISLTDPVRDEGFLGQWALENMFPASEVDDSEEEEE